ncbi:MAG: PSD1 and planctomycete cytochrome C domain-containing protein [Planctomycetota bacterium]|nr:PSD1 and planctomycete cytochrome C domain-containing protein [Planctomycetota bacterium]
MIRSSIFAMLALTCFAGAAVAQSKKIDPEQEEFFESRIRPVLVKNCYGCHSQKTGKARGGLMLDTREGLLAGGDSGEGLVPGSLDKGTLWSAINYEDWEMPPGRSLARNEIEDIRKWILMGAPDPRVVKIKKVNTSISRQDILAAKKEFWSFRQPVKTEPPVNGDPGWARGDIDHFIAAGLRENNLSPAADADAETFLRRLCVDLVGLPPNPEQLEWFSREWKTDPERAIAYVTDRLLDNERYGERWGRHWLDVARYAESSGKELNAMFLHAWRYRDYVIDSFNEDKPYDQFVREQIAGDLLPVQTDEQWAENLIATGFLAMGPKTLSEQNPRQFVADMVDEQIDTTTRVVLGLSVACARCHDHKFDPIPQTDYYAMAGVFLSTNTYFGTASLTRNRRPSSLIELPVDDPDPGTQPLTPAEIAEKKKERERLQEEAATILRNRRLAVRGQLYIDGKKVSANDPRVSTNQLGRVSGAAAALDAEIKSVKDNGSPASYCMGVQPREVPQNARLLVRGELNQPAQEVERGFVQVLLNRPARISSKSGGRLEMAKWMTDEKNPLTARVMVNRIWQHLFGDGIVATPENFGATGQSPTHPELLDYLAVRFMESNWSVKTIIKEIVTSRTYRMSSEFDQDNFEIDPDNRYRWRANKRRIDAEVLRDSMLFVSKNISFDRPRGSQVSQLAGTRQQLRTGQLTWDETKTYRSVYLPVMRDNLPRVLAVFDFAEPSMVMGKRESSNTPSQALYMLNNRFVLEQAESLARVLASESEDPSQQVNHAFVLCYGRNATPNEIAAANRFFDRYDSARDTRRTDQLGRLSAFCQALFASAEFRFLN